jgi:hypothetical protein
MDTPYVIPWGVLCMALLNRMPAKVELTAEEIDRAESGVGGALTIVGTGASVVLTRTPFAPTSERLQ